MSGSLHNGRCSWDVRKRDKHMRRAIYSAYHQGYRAYVQVPKIEDCEEIIQKDFFDDTVPVDVFMQTSIALLNG